MFSTKTTTSTSQQMKLNTILQRLPFLILMGFLLSVQGGCYLQGQSSVQGFDEVEDAIQQSASYLMKVTKKDGMFEYVLNMDPTIKVKKGYNILRHAGTIYSMSMYYDRYIDKDMLPLIKRAGAYLRDESIAPIPGKENMQAVWSKPEVNGGSHPTEVKLGGTGLGLVALMSIENIAPGFTPLSTLQDLGRSIAFMQKEDGSFYSKYTPSKGGFQENWTSLYYPGEAALGLLMLYEKDPSPLWLQTAYGTLEYLALSRKNSTNIPADHWALLATEKLLSLEPNEELPISRELLINHAIQICETILQSQIDQPNRPNDGGFSKTGNTTPTATRLEGLLATLSFLPPDHEIRERIKPAIARGISFLVRAQVKEGLYAGAIPRAVEKRSGSSSNIKSFNRRVSEVRIDYNQHAMSAMIQYQRLKKRG